MAVVPSTEKLPRYVGDPWEQQPGESAKQFARFTRFSRLSVKERRTAMAAMAAEFGVDEATIREYCERYRWRERADLQDAQHHQDIRATNAAKEAQLAERAINLALVGATIMGRSMRALADSNAVLDAKELPGFAKMLETLRKIAIDAPDQLIAITQRAGVDIVVPDFAGLSDDQVTDRAAEMARSMLRLIDGGKTA